MSVSKMYNVHVSDYKMYNLIHYITDRDECQVSPCDHLCTDTEGSFECSCMLGYELQADGLTCKGELYTIKCFPYVQLFSKSAHVF